MLLKVLAGKTERDYEAMLAGGVSTAAASVTREEVDGHVAAAGSPEHLRTVRELMAAVPPRPSSPPTIPARPAAPAVPPPIPGAAPAPVVRTETLLWRRVEVAPGLELHVRSDYAVPDTRAKRESLLLAVLESLQPGGRSLRKLLSRLRSGRSFNRHTVFPDRREARR